MVEENFDFDLNCWIFIVRSAYDQIYVNVNKLFSYYLYMLRIDLVVLSSDGLTQGAGGSLSPRNSARMGRQSSGCTKIVQAKYFSNCDFIFLFSSLLCV